jgi:hypothetical protein
MENIYHWYAIAHTLEQHLALYLPPKTLPDTVTVEPPPPGYPLDPFYQQRREHPNFGNEMVFSRILASA